MMGARVTATDAAREAIAQLRETWGSLIFIQPAGCCGASAPMCYPVMEFLAEDGDLTIGEIDGCPFHIDKRLYQAWCEPDLLLDVEPGYAEGFSLPPGPGTHFVVRTPSDTQGDLRCSTSQP